MKSQHILALAILGIILVSGCVGQGTTPATSTGITSKLEISKAPALNENAEITLTVITIRTAPTASAKITLPEGFELVSGDLNWNGELVENQPLQLKATVKAVKTGNWAIFGGGAGQGDYLYITVNQDSASVSEKPFPIPKRGKQYAESN